MVFLSRSDATLSSPVSYNAAANWGESLAVGDFNDDGFLDVAVGSSLSSVGVLFGRGDGTFSPVTTYNTGDSYTAALSSGDFNGDGRADLACGGSNLEILLNGGGDTFEAPITLVQPGYTVTSLAAGDFNGDGRTNIVETNGGSLSFGLILSSPVGGLVQLTSPNGRSFDVQPLGVMAGQLVQGPNDAFDGLNRLQVGGVDYAPTPNATLDDKGQTVVTGTQSLAGLNVHREVTVPSTGNEDFARTVEVLENRTGSPITTTVRIVGNLGSDAATTVFATSSGDTTIDTSDQWIGTDDADGKGSPAIIHYIHGPQGLQPTSVIRTGDNIEWTYNITVPAGQTLRLAEYTILATNRSDAIAAANAVVLPSGFGGQAAAFLAPDELASLANFQFIPLTITGVGPVTPDPRQTPVSTVDVVFSKPIDLATFTYADLALTINGRLVTLDGTVTTSFLSGTTYRISGLDGFTGAVGSYVLTVMGTGINDLAGNTGSGAASDSWSNVGVVTVTLGVPSPIAEGQSARVTGTIANPPSQNFDVMLSYGDGGSDTLSLAGGTTSFYAEHHYDNESPAGGFTITAQINGVVVGTTTVTVTNTPPTVVIGPTSDIALNTSDVGFPTPLESDPGWGGGSYPWEIVNGQETYSDWAHGLAFTGGNENWAGQPAGPRQATIDLGQNETFDKIVLWHHGDDHVPQQTSLDYWNGSSWVPIAFTRTLDIEPGSNGWSRSDTYTFAPVTGSKVRYSFDNRLLNILGTQITHGWLYEFEVWSKTSQITLGGSTLTYSGSFSDPGANDTFTATVNYGDGTGNQQLSLNSDRTFALSHAYASGGTFTVTVKVTDENGGVGTDTLQVVVPSSSSKATFVGTDTTTEGAWIGAYGADGYDIIGNAVSLPSYAAVTPAGQSSATWNAGTTDARALQKVGANNRIAACWYAGQSFTVDLNLTDGKTHSIAAYFLDWDTTARSERVDVIDPATGAVLDTRTVSSFHNGTYLVWKISGHVQLRFTKLSGGNAVLSGLFLGDPAKNSATANFVNADTTTQGAWTGTYGSDGYDIIGNAVSLPSYAAVTPAGQSSFTWNSGTSDPRALQKVNANNGIAACWYASQSFTVDLNLTDGKTHSIAAYFLDWDTTARSERVDVIDPATGAVLDTRTVSSFHNGTYLVWKVSGHVQLRFTRLSGGNAVLSGLFLGDPAKNSAAASFVGTDTTTQGAWTGTYGSDGYDIIGNAVSLPSYAAVAPVGQSSVTWNSGTSDPRALQKVGANNGIAACWYASQSFTVDLNLTDGKTHSIAAYFLDWDTTARSERVDVIDPATGAVLDTRTVSSFHNGTYLVWKISGHVQLRFTKLSGGNAVLSGLFFGPSI